MSRSDVFFDTEVKEAIRQAVREEGLDEAVSDRLLAWLQATARGESNLQRSSDVEEHYKALAAALAQTLEDAP
jgi:hypothetical protein